MAPFLLFNYPHRKRYFLEFKNFSEIDIYLLLWNAQTIKKELFLEMFTKKSIELFYWFICMQYVLCIVHNTSALSTIHNWVYQKRHSIAFVIRPWKSVKKVYCLSFIFHYVKIPFWRDTKWEKLKFSETKTTSFICRYE